MAADREDWAGIPMPLENEALIVEPNYPNAQALMAMCGAAKADNEDEGGFKLRSAFYSHHKRCDVHVIVRPDGKITCGLLPAVHHLREDLRTLGCSEAWGIEQESKAIELLGSLVEHHKFKQYLLTGSFLERSTRSGLFYLFRRLKPTVAIKADTTKNTTEILCALCLHPIAYYQGSWAGAMAPSDDVVAHLMLMRGDEKMFWRRANQHPAHRPEAGL